MVSATTSAQPRPDLFRSLEFVLFFLFGRSWTRYGKTHRRSIWRALCLLDALLDANCDESFHVWSAPLMCPISSQRSIHNNRALDEWRCIFDNTS